MRARRMHWLIAAWPTTTSGHSAATIVSRATSCPAWRAGRGEAQAVPVDRRDQPRAAVAIADGDARAADALADRGVADDHVGPQRSDDRLARDELPGMAREQDEQVEDLRIDVDERTRA